MKLNALILATLLLQSCGLNWIDSNPVKTEHKITPKLQHTIINDDLYLTTTKADIQLSTNNYNNSTEHKALTQLESYLRNSNNIIKRSMAVRNKDSRYKFNYRAVTSDIAEIANSINRFVNQDKFNQAPRAFEPLSKRY
jgi:RAQPRD family integrative conjugative element protein